MLRFLKALLIKSSVVILSLFSIADKALTASLFEKPNDIKAFITSLSLSLVITDGEILISIFWRWSCGE